jgi:transcriptional regulator with XRE-family HTH domain
MSDAMDRALKAAAVLRGITLKQIADEFAVSTKTGSRWLRRETQVPDVHKRRLAAMLGLTIDDLLPPKEPTNGESSTQTSDTKEAGSASGLDQSGAS